MATRRIRPGPSPRQPPAPKTGPRSDPPRADPAAEVESIEVSGDGSSLPTLHVGRRVGRYRLCGEVASGGMATVHVALLEGAAGFEKLVALKAIHPHLAKKPSFVQMFLDEARLASRIEHPNVCHVFDFGEAEGGYYLTMEYLAGVTLKRFVQTCRDRGLDREPRYIDLVARIVADAAEGLHAAHELTDRDGHSLQVVHRDVSPQNIFVTYAGVTKVVDFGIAQAKNKLHQTHTGEVKGNFPYVAPEQIAGREVARQADIWSLGVVTWEMLCGRSLFRRANSMKTMFAVTRDPIPDIRQLRPSTPAAVARVIQRALDRTPGRRHPSARRFGRELLAAAHQPVGTGELAEVMESLFPGEQARARSFVACAMELRPTRSRRWRRWALVAAALLGAATTAFLMAGERVQGTPTQEAAAAPLAREAAPALEPPAVRPASSEPGPVQPPRGDRSADPNRLEPPRAVPERSRPTRPTRMRSGLLNLVTPGASSEVLHRGRSLGWTPLSKRLPAGSYLLEIRAPRAAPKRVRIRIRPQSTTRRTVNVQ